MIPPVQGRPRSYQAWTAAAQTQFARLYLAIEGDAGNYGQIFNRPGILRRKSRRADLRLK